MSDLEVKMANLSAIVLAAGHGKRLKSSLIKVAHSVAGKPVLSHVLDRIRQVGCDQLFVVVGHQAEFVKSKFRADDISFVYQKEQLGTGHAVQQASSYFEDMDDVPVLILAGDCPFVSAQTLTNLLECHQQANAKATVFTALLDNPQSYGRLIRTESGFVEAIIEAKDCTPEQLQVKEVNSGIYLFQSKALFSALNQVNCNNKQGEFYLTDVIQILVDQGETVSAYVGPSANEMLGINTRADLALIERVFREAIVEKHMNNGVTFIDPTTVYIDASVEIGADTIIEPMVVIKGDSKIGSGCTIKANSYLENITLDDGKDIEPFSNIVNT